jgi:surface antigen
MRLTQIALTAVLLTTACAGTSQISETMNEADRERLDAAHYYAFHGTLSQKSVWANAATGIGGMVRSFDEFTDPETGQRCRRFIENKRSTDGQQEYRIGTTCQCPDGDLTITLDPRR